jgi:hypothetical protein
VVRESVSGDKCGERNLSVDRGFVGVLSFRVAKEEDGRLLPPGSVDEGEFFVLPSEYGRERRVRFLTPVVCDGLGLSMFLQSFAFFAD